jgi:hypothetical protein
MLINADTKIAAVLKQHPEAMDAIIGLSPKFNALRNPLLRKLMAGRTSIATAAKMGGCTVDDFFRHLAPLGFKVDDKLPVSVREKRELKPAYISQLSADQLHTLDVRPVLDAGKDPLSLILQTLKEVKQGQALLIINSFEPTPLIHLLEKQGYETFVDIIEPDCFYTYLYRTENIVEDSPAVITTNDDFDETLHRFTGKLDVIDVRQLPMPMPMHTILQRLEQLPQDHALFVFHKRIPVFLLPELADRQLSYRVKKLSDSEVQMLIFND